MATLLIDNGHDVVTVAGLGMCGATDPEVLTVAAEQERLLVTLDTDVGGLLVHAAAVAPSVLVFDHRPQASSCRGYETSAHCRTGS